MSGNDPNESFLEELRLNGLDKPSDAIGFAVRGMMFSQRGMEAEAEADFRASLRMEPRAETHLALASTLAMLHRPLEALAETEAALRLQPNCDTLLLRAGLLHVLHRHDEALETLRQAVALDPQYADAHLALGQALYDLKRYDESLQQTNEADGLQADNPETLVLRARIYHKLRRLEDAMDDLDRALELDPGDAHASANAPAPTASPHS